MAQKYRKVDPRIWGDEKFVCLTSDERLIALYCLTSSQVNRIGLFRFSLALAAEEMGTLPPTFAKRFGNVCQTFRWGFHEPTKTLYFPTWWKYNRPDNPNILKSYLADLHDVPTSPLIAIFCANTKYLPETFACVVRNVTPNVTPNVQAQEQEQEQEQEQDTTYVAEAVADKLSSLIAAWNAIEGVCTVRETTRDRQAAFRTRCKQPGWLESARLAIGRIAKSDFCRGGGDRGWRADFDWFLKPRSVTRVLEGKYDDPNGDAAGDSPTLPDLTGVKNERRTASPAPVANARSAGTSPSPTGAERRDLGQPALPMGDV